MTYVFDTSPFSALFKSFYRRRFPTLWAQFDALTEQGSIVSTREVLRELEGFGLPELQEWLGNNRDIFSTPTAGEAAYVAQIFAVPHFQQNIELKKIYKGGLQADTFVVAKAAVIEGTVVTLEKSAPNSARIPNICEHFGIKCINLEEFMEAEGWEF